jgi:predicted nucleic acid-binding protein
MVDTDVATWLLVDSPRAEQFRPFLEGRLLAISFATLGELLAYTYRLSWGRARRETWLERIHRTFVVVPFDIRVVEVWAPLHRRLHGHLHRGGTNDLWTAATALAQDPALPIVTNNLSDFRIIDGESPHLVVVHPDL